MLMAVWLYLLDRLSLLGLVYVMPLCGHAHTLYVSLVTLVGQCNCPIQQCSRGGAYKQGPLG